MKITDERTSVIIQEVTGKECTHITESANLYFLYEGEGHDGTSCTYTKADIIKLAFKYFIDLS